MKNDHARVLVVDDSDMVRETIAEILSLADYQVEVAEDGASALRRLTGAPFDVLVTDLHMPKMDGFGLLEAVRARDADIEAIILTGDYARDIDAAIRTLRLGACDFLQKPLPSPGALLAAVGRAVEIRRQRLALRAAEARYRELFDRVPIGLFRAAVDGRLLETNSAAAELLGYADRGALVGVNLCELFIEPEDRCRWQRGLDQDHGLADVETRLRGTDGTTTWASLSARVSRDEDGGMYYEGMMMDISARRQAEMELRQTERMEAIGNLAGGMAHDFNNLLGIILGAASLMERNPVVRGRLESDLARIRAAAERAARLTRQLLAFSRRQVLQPQLIDLNALVHGVRERLALLAGPHTSVRVTLAVGPMRVRVDPQQMEQVLLSLVTNACEAMPAGGEIVIETVHAELAGDRSEDGQPSAPGRYVALSIRDTGPGMDATVRAHLFEPFFSTKPKEQGAGLGLAMVHGTILQSGGRLAVSSEPGRGSTITVYLPAVATDERPHLEAASTPAGGPAQTVIVVEDDEGLRSLLRRGLMLAGYDVLDAADGAAAVDVARNHPGRIALLVTDVVLPGMNGPEVAEELRRTTPEIRTLFMTGYADDALRGILASGASVLQKPFTLQALCSTVRGLLGGGSDV
jgi:two-component system, cell cycle sensor histidine kinase and response regulator CckA